MNTQNQTPSAVSLPAAPYVGMRPFERDEQAIFFGRERDASLLRDKVFSTRLTVLYGPSGIGKSSILRSLLIPYLEAEDARVIYFEDWRSDDPAATLKARLLEEAEALKIPNPGAGAPNLTDLIRLLISSDNRTLVLILDQFEEFFTTHGQRLDPLRKELGAVVRTPNLDVRILLSLREEHLASLEPFRAEILNLFQSTYRLEVLNAEGVRKAIDGPAKLFGVDYEPELLEKLIVDLRSKKQEVESDQRERVDEPTADLPMLQLICEELWKGAKKRDQKTISLGLYQEMKERQGILKAYLHRVMPSRRGEQHLTARLMRHLAPPDGHKVSFSAEHLASLTEFRRERVKSVLERLSDSKVRVLRSRHYGIDRVLYELWHDSFIGILAPWRDAILGRIRRWRRWLRFAGALILVAAAVGSALHLEDLSEIQRNTEELWADTSLTADQRIDNAALYLLWGRKGSKRLDILRDFLEKYQHRLSSSYGLYLTESEIMTPPDLGEDWIFTVQYSPWRNLDTLIFKRAWQVYAQYLNEDWGIPVPLFLKLDTDDTLENNSLRLTGSRIEPLEFIATPYEKEAFMSSKDISKRGKEFLEKFEEEWTPITETERNGPWYAVPRWSLPAWKASGVFTIDINALPAYLLADYLLKNPDRLLTPDVVEILLYRTEILYPYTVTEVHAVRGNRLPGDLQEVVKNELALTGLPVLLDVLAGYPEGSSADIIEDVIIDREWAKVSLPDRLRGPHTESVPYRLDEEMQEIQSAYADAELLPEVEPLIRIYMGKNLQLKWITGKDEFRPVLSERLEKIREDILRRFGLTRPGISFRTHVEDPDIPTDAFRIEVLNQRKDHNEASPIYVFTGEGLDTLSELLIFRIELYRSPFLIAERADELLRTDPELKSWLEARYSLTDLKLLLRAVICPSDDEIYNRKIALEFGAIDEVFQVPPENSIRYPEWLLASLVFWSKAHDLWSLPAMAEDLRETQRARLYGHTSTSESEEIVRLIAGGIRALADRRFAEAEATFSRAVEVNADAAISGFLALYPQVLRSPLINKFKASCTDLDIVFLESADRIDLEDLLAEEDFEEEVSTATARHLRLGLLAAYPESYRQAQNALVDDIVKRYGMPDTWPVDEAAWFGKKLLSLIDPLEDDKSIIQNRLDLYLSSFSRLSVKEAQDQVRKVLEICYKDGPNKWCWDNLHTLTQVHKDPIITYFVADALAIREVQADLERAITLVENAKDQLQVSALGEADRKNLLHWIDLTRATGLVNLARFEYGKNSSDAEEILLTLQKSEACQHWPYFWLARLRGWENRIEDALALVNAAMDKWPGVELLYGSKLNLMLRIGDRFGISQIAKEALTKVEKDWLGDVTEETQGFAFQAALGLLITETGDWHKTALEFLETDHEYVPYIAMMLFSRLSGKDKKEALHVIERYWIQARPPDTWGVRLREGDATAWREMLIGYYLGKVDHDQIFADLEDEARFAQSDLHWVPMTRQSMLCEAYFYDAILAEAEGDAVRMKSSLKKVLLTDVRDYYEYGMAKFLLAQWAHDAQYSTLDSKGKKQ